MTEPVEYREFAGFRVPLDMVPRFVEALRGTYPSVTDSIVDHDAAVRAVVRHWFITTFAAYEEAKVSAELPAVLEETRATYRGRAASAREQALADADRILEIPTA